MAERDTDGLKTRKEPAQARSRALVAAVEEAALRILRDDGELTVELLCRVAGVSPGSFYQYFPHLDAVRYRLLRRHAEAVTGAILAVLEQHGGGPAEVLIREAVQAFVVVHAADPLVHARLGRAVASVAGPGLEPDLIHRATHLVEALVTARLPGRDPKVVAFLLVRGLEGVVHAAARDAPELLEDAGFVDGVVAMLRGVVGAE